MACDEAWLEILSAWHDGEATEQEVARARAHLPRCAACRSTRARFWTIRAALRSAHRGSSGERTRTGAASGSLPGWRPRRGRLLAGALAAAVAVALLIRGAVTDGRKAVVDELEARHLVAFARATPCDFASADPAAVRDWIAGQLGQRVEVPAVSGATLLGARRCRLSGVPTVSLLYRRGDEPLSLFVAPPGTPTARENARLARASAGCTVGHLGAAVCARPGLFAVAPTSGTAMAALESF